MTVEVWSDYACPFCYIGEKRLERALAEVGEKISVAFKSFELDPAAPKVVTSSTTERFAAKYGLTLADAAERIEQISRMGRAEGIDFRYAETKYTNTFDALRLTKFAQAHGHDEIVTKFFDAYFTRNLELSDHAVLKKISAECDLDASEVDEILRGDRYAEDVRADEMQAAYMGIHAVPYFVVGRHGLSGAQPVEVLKRAITDALTEDVGGMACGVDGCNFEGR